MNLLICIVVLAACAKVSVYTLIMPQDCM